MTEKIQDAEVEPVENREEKKDNSKRDWYVELALFAILGLLLGIAIKTEAAKRITIGFNDYKMKSGSSNYNINKMQSDLAKKAKEKPATNSGDGSVPAGAICGQ